MRGEIAHLLLLHRVESRLRGHRCLRLSMDLRSLHLCRLYLCRLYLCRLHLRLHLRLLGLSDLSSLSASLLCLLLLLNPRRRRLVDGARFEVRRRGEWSGILMLCDEWMESGLLWRPALEWIDVQQSLYEIDEGFAMCVF